MNPTAIMRTALVLWLAAAASVLPFTNITRDRLMIGDAVALAGVLVFLAGGLRLARLRPLVVHGVQLLFLGGVLIVAELQIRTAQGQSVGLRAVVDSAITQLRDESAPLGVYPPTRWLLVAFLALLVIVADVMVSTLGATAWALLPIATPYIITTLTISGDLPWWQFALVSLGYLAMLAVEAVNRNEEWT
ncbi:MAG: transglutaminaseTgpA domain-containing protein, partial [Propionibacterium sp.]|nr:transglutaminaseTgpA domain-containing protein [Propionibacterium sp.]